MSPSRRILSAVLLLVAASLAFGCRDKTPSRTAQGKDFILNDIEGNEVRLVDYRRKAVLLEFWATWCPPCRMAVPDLIKLQERFRDRDFAILAVSVDEPPERLRIFAEEHGITYRVLIDDQHVSALYGVRSIPTTFILDKEGQVIKQHLGYSPEMADTFAEEIEGLL